MAQRKNELEIQVAFDQRSLAGSAVNGTGRTRDENLDSEFAAGIEEIESAADAFPFVKLRLFDRRSNAGADRHVDDDVRAPGVFQIGKIPGGRLEIVEGIDNGEFRAAGDESVGEVRADRSGASRQQDFSCGIYQEILGNLGNTTGYKQSSRRDRLVRRHSLFHYTDGLLGKCNDDAAAPNHRSFPNPI